MQKHESALTSQRALSQGWFLVYTHPGSVQMVFLNSLNGHVLSFLASLLGMWDLNSLTMDRTLAPCISKSNLNHWTARKVPCCSCSVAQSCLTLCEPVNCSPPGSSVHGISQARILEWVAISSCRGSSRPRDPTHVSCTGRWIPYHWAIREAQEKSWACSFARLLISLCGCAKREGQQQLKLGRQGISFSASALSSLCSPYGGNGDSL